MDPRIECRLRNAITAGRLIDRLKDFPEDAIVGFQSDYGDYTHTQQFLYITEENIRELEPSEEEIVFNNGYSKSGLAIREKDEPDEDELAELTDEERKKYEAERDAEPEYSFVILS